MEEAYIDPESLEIVAQKVEESNNYDKVNPVDSQDSLAKPKQKNSDGRKTEEDSNTGSESGSNYESLEREDLIDQDGVENKTPEVVKSEVDESKDKDDNNLKNNGRLPQGPNESENETINKESDQLDENQNNDHISNGNPAEPDKDKQEKEVQAENITDPVLTSNEELLNGYDHEAPPKVAEEQKTKEEKKQTIEETSEITNNNDGRDGAKPEEQEIAGDYIEDNDMKGDQDIVDKADDHKDEQPHDDTIQDNPVPPEEQTEGQQESEELPTDVIEQVQTTHEEQHSEPDVEPSAEIVENPVNNEEDKEQDNAQIQNSEEADVADKSDCLNEKKFDNTEITDVNTELEDNDRAQNYENAGVRSNEEQKEGQQKEEQFHDTHHSDLGNSNLAPIDEEELLQILGEAEASFKKPTHQEINGQKNSEDGDEQVSEKDEDINNNEFDEQQIDGNENCEEGDSNEEEIVKNEFDPKVILTERLEEVQNAETNSSENQVDQVPLINIEENKNSCETQVELNNKALITQICDSIDSSVTTRIGFVNQVLESLKSEIIANNEKIDSNITIMNENKEVLNESSSSLSLLSSSIKAIQNLISELPQSKTINLQFSIINYSLTTLSNMIKKKADQDTIQSELESQTDQINKIREEFQTEYKQLLDTKDTEIKKLNQQLEEQKTETEKYRKILEKQTIEYARDKQELEQNEKTIVENKKLLENQNEKINNSNKKAEDAVRKQSILQSKLEDQTKRHKQELKIKADELNETVKRQKEELIKKTDELNEEAKKLREELNMTILNLEDKLRGQTSIVDQAKGEIKSREDLVRELMNDKDDHKKEIKNLNKKLNDGANTIQELQKELKISGEKSKELEERIKCKEQEHSRILAEKKVEINKVKDQLDKNLQEFEKLKQKNYNESAMVILNLRNDIQELAALEQVPNLFYNKLDLLLTQMTEFDAFQDFKIIDLLFNRIIKLKDSKNDEKLAEDLQEENCQQIIDFIFKLKDKFPSSSQEKQDELDIFDKIMDFMTENNLMPSKELIEKYKKSKTNSQLDIPDYETLNHHIEMKEEEYELLIENTKNKEEFVYFFDNNNIKIEEQIGKTKEGNKFLVISHCSKNSNEMIGAGLMIYSNGEIYQGYFKANKLHFFGRTIFTDSECYTGKYINNKRKEIKKDDKENMNQNGFGKQRELNNQLEPRQGNKKGFLANISIWSSK